jgi:two-component system, OmpR family, phosphate regulon sensor histidine kinase PhoR
MIEGIAILFALAALTALLIVSFRFRTQLRRAYEDNQTWKDRVERELKQAREERNRLLDALDDAFLLVDSTGTIRFTNSLARELFGPSAQISRHFSEVLSDPRLCNIVHQTMATGEPAQDRIVLAQQTSPRGNRENRGINAWIIDAARLPATDSASTLTRIIIRDVTTEHQIEQIRKDFVANASHELRTPMAIINGYLENLLDDDMVEDPQMARRFLSVMRKHAERISRIVEDMLVISRLESGEANSLKIEPFRFRSCLQDVLERLESLVHSQQAEINIELSDESISLLGDRFYWTQVLFNLIENALKQNPHPGLQIHVGCRTEGDRIHIWVADDGIGIPSADLPHIFRRFYRVEKHHSQREIKGTGLGLSIVKRAIEAHGGTICVTSTPGRDTRFHIDIPATPPIVIKADPMVLQDHDDLD